MHCLEEIRLSFRTKEYLEHPDRAPAEEPLLRTLSQGPGLKSAKSTKVIISLFHDPVCFCSWIALPVCSRDLLTVMSHSHSYHHINASSYDFNEFFQSLLSLCERNVAFAHAGSRCENFYAGSGLV